MNAWTLSRAPLRARVRSRTSGSRSRVGAKPHGSALANMVAARDATVIELFNERRRGNGCFYAMSAALDFDYWYLRCEARRGEHLWVDPALLEATLEAALGPSRAAS